MNALPTKDAFSAELNTIFTVQPEEKETFEMKLVEVKNIVSNKLQECFALLFAAPVYAPVVQQTFRLKHNAFGTIELFLVPVKKTDDEIFLEAVFNKLLA